jgi:PAS domain S-box-containing protein
MVKSEVDEKARLAFDADCHNVQGRIEERLRAHEQILRSGAAFFADTDGVSREEWHGFAERQKVGQKLPGIQGIGFAVRVPREQLAAHERAVRAEGFSEYRVWPEGERDAYTSIVFLEPFTGRNLRAFGYDMFSEPVRRAAMEMARDEDLTTLSGKVRLVQENGQDVQTGTLMYAPVYRIGAACTTVAERRAALIGWVYSPYRMNDLMEGILDNGRLVQQKQLHLQIHDGATADLATMLYDSDPNGSTPAAPQAHRTRQVRINSAGHQWLLVFAMSDAAATSKNGEAWVTLGVGACISGLLAGLVFSLVHTRSSASRLAQRLTKDLNDTSNRLSLAVRAGGVGIWDYDVVNNRLVWDEQMYRLYGITREQFGGAYDAWQAGLHPDDRQRGDAEIQLALQNTKDFDIEFRVLWPDGTTRYIRGFASVERDAVGKPLRMIGTNWDITTQKLTAEALMESNTNFRTFFESMTDMIMVGTPEGRILFTNGAVTRMLGYTPAELQTMHLLDTHPADKRQEAEAIFGAMFRGERESCPLPLAHKDGSLIPVETRVWFGQWDGLDCLFGICKDLSDEQEAITARKHAEAELARLARIQHELLHLATEFVNVPEERRVAAIDESLATMGRLIDADRAYLFAYDFVADIMHNTHEWCGPGITPEIANLQAVPNALVPDWVTAHRDGELMHIPSVAALPVDEFLGQVLAPQGIRSLITLPLMQGQACLGFVGFDAVREERAWHDEEVALLRVLAELFANFEARRANEREARKLQENLIHARDAAQAAAMAKSLFLANMSHEIRTPLNAILGYSQIMQRECRVCPTSTRLSAINRSGEHLLELLTDLLELVRSDACATTLAPADFDFYQVLEDVRLMFVRHAQAQGLTLEIAHAPEVPQFIHADSGKVRQILVNLVGNAFKFTANGGVRVFADRAPGTTAEAPTLVVDVEDTGCGISDDELERIFDVFEQAQHGVQSGKGTGLGLPLSRRYARALGGDVSVASQLGAGCRFRFTFTAGAVSGGGAGSQAWGSVRQLAAGQRVCRVLVVDDEFDNRDMLVVMLTTAGFSVEAVDDAAQALERLQRANDIDLVLMDKRLPGMDGYTAITHLRQLPGGREVPVLVVTASGFADEKAQALSIGADGYVSKPVHRNQLFAEISRVTGVSYDHDTDPVAPLRAAPPLLDAAALACLPAATRHLLEQALRRGDIQQLRDLVAGIEREHAGLAAGMRILSDAYDYDRLYCLLESIPSESL